MTPAVERGRLPPARLAAAPSLRALGRAAAVASTCAELVLVGGRDTETPRERAERLQWACARLCAAHGITLSVHGRPPVGAAVVVSNHLGWIDPLVLASLLPVSPLAKREIATWPLLGSAARRLGVEFVRRGDAWDGARALRRARRTLRAGVAVLAFPEGTTTAGTHVLPLRRGVFGLAALADVPVVPVRLWLTPREASWVGDAPFLPHYVQTSARAATHARVRFFPALHPRDFPGAAALAAIVWQQLARA